MDTEVLNKELRIGLGIIIIWITITSTAVAQQHDTHSHQETPSSATLEQHFEATLSSPHIITPGKMIPLTIQIQDAHGRLITDFEMFQEALMHLIVVSEDLRFFIHLHPAYDGHGNFDITTQFPSAGVYSLFSDYQPIGQAEQVSVLKVEILGTPPIAPVMDFTMMEKVVAETMVRLSVSPMPLKAHHETIIKFELRQASNGLPVADLSPYLGEKGHLVIIKQSPTLTRADYIHAHAMKDSETSVIQFMTHFPQRGVYKFWGQFKRGETLITADFWIDVKL